MMPKTYKKLSIPKHKENRAKTAFGKQTIGSNLNSRSNGVMSSAPSNSKKAEIVLVQFTFQEIITSKKSLNISHPPAPNSVAKQRYTKKPKRPP